MGKKTFIRIIAFILIGVCIAMIGDKYIERLGKEKKSEIISISEKKKSSILLGQGENIDNTELEVYKSNYYVAYNNLGNVVLLKLDEKGNEISNIAIKEKSSDIRNINIFNDEKNLYLTYIIEYDDKVKLKAIKLDDNLNHLSIDEIDNISVSCKINENLLVVAHENRLSIINLSTSSLEYKIDDVSVKDVKVVKANAGNLIVYSTIEGEYYYLIYNDSFQEPKLILNGVSHLKNYESMEIAFNGDNIYLFLRGITNSNNKNTYVVKYSIESNKVEDNIELSFNDDKKLKNICPYFEKNKLMIIGEVENKDNSISINKIEVKGDYSLNIEEEIKSGSNEYKCIKVKDDIIIYVDSLENQLCNINLFLK